MKKLQLYLVVLIICAGALNPVLATPIVIINEVLYDGPGTDADDVFTELFGAPGLVLDGWSLTGTNGATGSIYRAIDLTGAIIPADGIIVIATESATGLLVGVTDLNANVDWQNGPDSIQLWNASGEIVDALQYGDASANNRGEGNFVLDVVAGHSLSRTAFGTDTDDNSSDFTDLSIPTPGFGPAVTASVSEPAALSLFVIGCAGLATLKRRRKRT